MCFRFFRTSLARGDRSNLGAPMLKGKRILWVDDRPHTVQRLVDQLHEDGALVAVATSNDIAVQLVANHPFDLVVADIDRRGAEPGTELGIRFAAAGKHIPIIHFVSKIDQDAPLPVGSSAIVNDRGAILDLIRKTFVP